MDTHMELSRKNYWFGSIYFYTLFCGYAFVYSMYAIWLSQSLNLSGKEIGIIFSLNSIAAVCIQPFLGYMQDKLHTKQHLLYLNALFLFSTGPFFTFIYQPLINVNFYLGALTGAVYIAFVFLAMAGVVETYFERLSRYSNFEYGKIRLWGSLGWASAALFGGILINFGGGVIFWAASIVSLVPLAILLFKKIETPKSSSEQVNATLNISDVLAILKLKRFYNLAIYVLGVATIYTIYDQQFPVFYASLFENVSLGNEMYGYLNSTQIFLEATGFLVAPFAVNRIGVKNGLLLAGAIMFFRIFASGVIDNTVALSFIKLLHAVELPILMVSIFKYINLHFENKLSSTLFLIGFMFVMQLGAGFLSPIFGGFYDIYTFQSTYLLMSGIVFFFLLVSMYLLESDNVHERTSCLLTKT